MSTSSNAAPAAAPKIGKPSGLPKVSTNLNKSAATSTCSLVSSSACSSVPSVVSLRRSPSCTEVLNPNTDDFKVGEKVFVNGTKPGYIRFLGTTSFAPGAWSGVELEEETGKNDGSVNSVRYFQCKPQYGLFVRPYRLTRELLPDQLSSGASTPVGEEQVPVAEPAKVQKTSSGTIVCGNLRVGDRVLVNASSGLKCGTLRFLGNPEFASGAWAGVELNTATGKNDGSVAGKRYFECKMNYGLFAPINKVAKEGIKPGAAATSAQPVKLSTTASSSSVNRRTFSNLSTVRKAGVSGSQESISSVTSSASVRSGRIRLGVTSLANGQKTTKNGSAAVSATTSVLQEALNEKEEHVSQLLKERDMERGEVARAVNRVEELEEKLALIHSEHQKQILKKEEQIDELRQNIAEGSNIHKELLEQLDEEKRKLEVLEFRLEEEMVARMELKDDMERAQGSGQDKIVHKENDGEEEMFQLQEDLIRKDDQIFQLEKSLETRKSELENLLQRMKEYENQVNLYEQRQTRNLETIDELNLRLKKQEDLTSKLQEKSMKQDEDKAKLEEQVKELSNKSGDTRGQINKANNELKDKIEEMDNLTTAIKELTQRLEKETEMKKRLEVEVNNMKEQITLRDDGLENSKDNEKHLLHDIQRKEEEVERLEKQVEEFLRSSGDNSQQLMQINDELKGKQLENKELEGKIRKLEEELSRKTKESKCASGENEEMRRVIESKDGSIELLNRKAADLEKYVQRKEESVERLEKQVDELLRSSGDNSQQLTQLNEGLKEKQMENNKFAERIRNTEEEMSRMEKERKSLSEEMEEMRKVAESKDGLIELLNRKESDYEETVKRKDLELKKFEKQVGELLRSSGDNSQQLTEMNEELKAKQSENRKLEENIKSLEERLRKSEKDKSALLSEVEGIKKVVDIKEDSIALLKQKEAELEDTINVNSMDMRKVVAQIEELLRSSEEGSQQLIRAKEDLKDTQSQNKELEETIRRLEQQLNSTEIESSSLGTQLEEIKRVVENNKDQIEILKRKELESEEVIRRKDEEVRRLEMHLENTIKRSDDSSRHLDKLNEENRDKQGSIKKLKETIKELKENIQKDEQEKRKLLTEVQEAKKLYMERESRMDQMSRKQLDLESDYLRQIQGLKEEKNELEVEKDKLMRDLRTERCGLDEREDTIRKMREQLEVTRKEFDDYRRSLEEEISRSKLEGELLEELKRDIYNVQEENDKLRSVNEDMKAKMVSILQEMETVQTRNSEVLNEFEAECHRLEQRIEEKTQIIAQKDQFIEQMETEGQSNVDTWRTRMDQEKTGLIKKIQELETSLNANILLTKTSLTVSSSIKSSLTTGGGEDSDQLQSQIEFLNSVIVDMQKKNDELKARVQLLEEIGLTDFDESADLLNENGTSGHHRPRAPRLFCDICDVFDIHDTEDCPQQAGSMDEINGHSKHNAKRSEERPYCNSCEVFGHWTEQCDDSESF